jgi:TP53 regulating kinase-like protein
METHDVLPFKKGAEAYLFKEEWYGVDVVRKRRAPKEYRVPELDCEIRRARTASEARLMFEACRVGVPTPSLYFVSLEDSTIVMQFIEGEKVKDILDSLGDEERRKVCCTIGQQIAMLHKSDIVHGDLTTSNMVLTKSGKVFFIDFGLGEFSSSVEDKGVDLHLMRRALQSAHYKHSVDCFGSILEGYRATLGESQTEEILRRIREIELRGRYFKRTSNK